MEHSPDSARPLLHQRTWVVVLCWLFGGGVGLGWLAVGIVSLWPVLLSAMLFDAPGSEDNTYLWMTVGSLVATPVLCIISALSTPVAIVLGRVMQRLGRVKLGWAVVALSLPLACLPLISMAGVVVGFGLIELLCDGSFVCP